MAGPVKGRAIAGPSNVPVSETKRQEAKEAIKFGEFGKYMKNKKIKLNMQQEELRQIEIDEGGEAKPPIFEGLVIHINGATDPPSHQMRALIISHEGAYLPYLDGKGLATHIVTNSLTAKKRKEFEKYRIVVPAFILDSIKAGKLQDWTKYRLDINTRLDQDDINAGVSLAQPTLFSAGMKVTKPSLSQEKAKHSVPAVRLLPSPAKTIASPQKSPNKRKLVHPEGPRDDQPVKKANTSTDETILKLLADDQWRIDNTAAGEHFLKGYYESSRLHWLSQWKSEFVVLVRNWRKANGKTEKNQGPARLKGDETDGRTIMHVDFDSFFVAAVLIDKPELQDKPVAVCHAGGRDGTNAGSSSEIASCNYAARKFGIKNGDFLGGARKKCPDIITVPYDFELYRRIANQFYGILFSRCLDIEAVSVDEAYILVDPTTASDPAATDPALSLAEEIRQEILDKTSCSVSIGVSHNKLLARLATKHAKPAKCFHLLPEDIDTIIPELEVDDIPKVGWANKAKIEEAFGSTSMKDLIKVPKGRLIEVLQESMGHRIWNAGRGIDATKLTDPPLRDSVSVDVNYGIRFVSNEEVEAFMLRLGHESASRLQVIEAKGRMLSIAIMERAPDAPVVTPKFLGHGTCIDHKDSERIANSDGSATDDGDLIGQIAWKLLKRMNILPHELRGIGLQITKLEHPTVLSSQKTLGFVPVPKPLPQPIAQKPKRNKISALKSHFVQEPSIIDLDAMPDTPLGLPAKTPAPNPRVKKASKETPNSISEDELRALDIDPVYFRDLNNRALQNDVILIAKREQARKKLRDAGHSTPNEVQLKILPQQQPRARSKSARPDEGADIVSGPLIIQRPVAPSLFGRKGLPDEMTEGIGQWVDERAASGPRKNQVQEFADYLVSCISGPVTDLDGVVRLLQYFNFALWQVYEEGNEDQTKAATKWDTSYDWTVQTVQDAMQVKYGAKLKIVAKMEFVQQK